MSENCFVTFHIHFYYSIQLLPFNMKPDLFRFFYRYRWTILGFMPFLLLILFFAVVYKPARTIAISGNEVQITCFTDQQNGGHSEIECRPEPNVISFRYTLRPGYEYPYVGLRIVPTDSLLLDLHEYDHIEISMRASRGVRVPVVLGLSMDTSSATDFLSYRFLEKIIEVDTSLAVRDIALASFETPDWWLKLNKKDDSEIPSPDFSKIRFINIQSCHLLPHGVRDEVTIQAITVTKNYKTLIQGFALFLLFYYLVLVLLWKRNSGLAISVNNEVLFHYHKTETPLRLENDEQIVFDYLAKNYQNSDLSITTVQRATGISGVRIATLIKKQTNLTFKQFLNKLRLTESKRLLKETDMQVAEIAYQIGYANVTHFNRTFKGYEQKTPLEFRKTVD